MNAIQVAFQGTTLFVVEHQSQPYVPMKPVVEGMGLAWQAQHAKLKANRRWGITEIVTPSSGGAQGMLCLPLRKLPGWLSTIHPNKVRPELRDKIIAYQNECDDILWAAWQQKAGPAAPALSHLINVDQQGELATLIAERFPDGKYRPYAWSRFNNHFRIATYKHLPASKFAEACEYIKTIPIKGSQPHPTQNTEPSVTTWRWIGRMNLQMQMTFELLPDDAVIITPAQLAALKHDQFCLN